MVTVNQNPPEPPVPPKPPNHRTIADKFAGFMRARFGETWRIRLPKDQREQLRDQFYGGFAAMLSTAIPALNGWTIPEDYAASLLNWRAEILDHAAELKRRSKPK